MRLLLIERDDVSAHLKAMLSSDGFQVQSCGGCDYGIDLLKTYEYDAIVLGRTLAGGDIGAIKDLRAAGIAIPILVLLDDALVSSRLSSLAQGADDCLSKPFHKAELGARLRAIIRRSKALPHSIARVGNLEIDLELRAVRVCGRPLHLTGTEYRMLELLALRKGHTVSKERIFSWLYDGHDVPEDHVINVFVCKLRKKIAALNHGQSYITTAWGGGYQMREPLAAEAA